MHYRAPCQIKPCEYVKYPEVHYTDCACRIGSDTSVKSPIVLDNIYIYLEDLHSATCSNDFVFEIICIILYYLIIDINIFGFYRTMKEKTDCKRLHKSRISIPSAGYRNLQKGGRKVFTFNIRVIFCRYSVVNIFLNILAI